MHATHSTAAALSKFFGFTKEREVKDGDGDGLIHDGTPEERPVEKADQKTGGVHEWALQQFGDPAKAKAFTKWFVDSKIVDGDGNPLVVYHGSMAEFSEFDPKKIGKSSGNIGHYGAGFYFSTEKMEAETYGDNVNGFYLSLQNPWQMNEQGLDELRDNGIDWIPEKIDVSLDAESISSAMRKRDPVAGDLFDLMRQHGYSSGWDEFEKKHPKWVSHSGIDLNLAGDLFRMTPEGMEQKSDGLPHWAERTLENAGFGDEVKRNQGYGYVPPLHHLLDLGQSGKSAEFSETLQKLGYDGVWNGSEIAVFDPKKIKSVENRGTFDGATANVNKSLSRFFGFTKDNPAKDGDGDGLIYDGTDQEQSVDPAEKRSSISDWALSRFRDKAKAEAFTKWFGKSQVVDANGLPLMVYHGTGAEFNEFARSGARLTSIGDGYYFSPDPDTASSYATGDNPHVKPVYLRAEKMLDWGNLKDSDRNQIIEHLQTVVPEDRMAGFGSIVQREFPRANDDEAEAFYKKKKEETKHLYHDRAKAHAEFEKDKTIIRWMEPGLKSASDSNLKSLAQEYDQGIARRLGYDSARNGNEIVVFSPNQVKSATGNAGTFDPGSSDIRKSLLSVFGFTKDKPAKDGDGDGLVYDGTEQEQPVDKTQQEKSNGISEAIRENIRKKVWSIDAATVQKHIDRLRQSGANDQADEYARQLAEKIGPTKTALFKSWFGDWEQDPAAASKVIDVDGNPQDQTEIREPKPVFHGTGKGGWNKFEPRWGQATGLNGGGETLLFGPGFYFTEDPTVAESYSKIGVSDRYSTDATKEELGKVLDATMDAYKKDLQLWIDADMEADATHVKSSMKGIDELRQNLNTIDDHQDNQDFLRAVHAYSQIQNAEDLSFMLPDNLRKRINKAATSEVKKVYLKIKNPLDMDAPVDSSIIEKLKPILTPEIEKDLRDRFASGKVYAHELPAIVGSKTKLNEQLQVAGYDGLTHIGGRIMGGGKEHRVWIAFEPTQIKSVENEGTFNPADPDIRKSLMSFFGFTKAQQQLSLFDEDECGANAQGGGGFQVGNKCGTRKAHKPEKQPEKQSKGVPVAKTTTEAAKIAEDLGLAKSVEYKKISVEYANEINAALHKYVSKYGQAFDEIKTQSRKTAEGASTLMQNVDSYREGKYASSTLIINAGTYQFITANRDRVNKDNGISIDENDNELQALEKFTHSFERGNEMVVSSVDLLVAHEYGHLLTAARGTVADARARQSVMKYMRDPSLSKYAGTDGLEALAEIFTLHHKDPGKVTAQQKEFFNDQSIVPLNSLIEITAKVSRPIISGLSLEDIEPDVLLVDEDETATNQKLASFLGFTKAAEPDIKDGDGDGLIYDGTASERPATEKTAKPRKKRVSKPKDVTETPSDLSDHDFYIRASGKAEKHLNARRIAALNEVDAYREQVDGMTTKVKSLQTEIADLEKQYDKITDVKQRFPLFEKANRLKLQLTYAANDEIRSRAILNEKFRVALNLNTATTGPKFNSKSLTPEVKSVVSSGVNHVKQWASDEILSKVDVGIAPIVTMRDGEVVPSRNSRSFVTAQGKIMALAPSVTEGVVAHEFGHCIEYANPHIHKLAQGFLRKRVGGEEPIALAQKFGGGYEANEFGRKDNFETVFEESSAYYVGKYYKDATEVISMGIEQLHRDPVRFAENDPEYFNLMVGALQGVLK